MVSEKMRGLVLAAGLAVHVTSSQLRERRRNAATTQATRRESIIGGAHTGYAVKASLSAIGSKTRTLFAAASLGVQKSLCSQSAKNPPQDCSDRQQRGHV
jgi:hypothetical protein